MVVAHLQTTVLLLLMGAAALSPAPAAAAARGLGGGTMGGGMGGRALLQGPPAPLAAAPNANACLCVFGLQRVLTGKQDTQPKETMGDGACPANMGTLIFDSSNDLAGDMTISDLGQKMASTWCGQSCYLGIIAGSMAPSMQTQMSFELSKDQGNRLMQASKDFPFRWDDDKANNLTKANGPFLFNVDLKNAFKSVPKITDYYKKTAGVNIADTDVFFFDDVAENINGWRNTKYNARQVSCKSRETFKNKDVGLCGATADELNALKFKKGCNLCNGAACK